MLDKLLRVLGLAFLAVLALGAWTPKPGAVYPLHDMLANWNKAEKQWNKVPVGNGLITTSSTDGFLFLAPDGASASIKRDTDNSPSLKLGPTARIGAKTVVDEVMTKSVIVDNGNSIFFRSDDGSTWIHLQATKAGQLRATPLTPAAAKSLNLPE